MRTLAVPFCCGNLGQALTSILHTLGLSGIQVWVQSSFLPLNPAAKVWQGGVALLCISPRQAVPAPLTSRVQEDPVAPARTEVPSSEAMLGMVGGMVAHPTNMPTQHIRLPGTCECVLIWKKGLCSCN